MNPNKVPPEEIDAAWQTETRTLAAGLQLLAARYIAGDAPRAAGVGRVPQLPSDDRCAGASSSRPSTDPGRPHE